MKQVTMYADELVLYKVIDTESALLSLQEDRQQWAMTLNY